MKYENLTFEITMLVYHSLRYPPKTKKNHLKERKILVIYLHEIMCNKFIQKIVQMIQIIYTFSIILS